jgi:hypothetical protein
VQEFRVSEGLGGRSKDYKGSKMLSMLGKSLDDMLVQRLGDHLDEKLGAINIIYLQLLIA